MQQSKVICGVYKKIKIFLRQSQMECVGSGGTKYIPFWHFQSPYFIFTLFALLASILTNSPNCQGHSTLVLSMCLEALHVTNSNFNHSDFMHMSRDS